MGYKLFSNTLCLFLALSSELRNSLSQDGKLDARFAESWHELHYYRWQGLPNNSL